MVRSRAFLIPVTLVMHNFWGVADSATQQIQRAMFMKNLTMLGGALLITYFGAGPLSLDAFSSAKPRIEPLAGRPESRMASGP